MPSQLRHLARAPPDRLSGNQYSHLSYDQFRTTALGKKPSASSSEAAVNNSSGSSDGTASRRRRALYERDPDADRRILQSIPPAVDWVRWEGGEVNRKGAGL